jgi:hypothetical protein
MDSLAESFHQRSVGEQSTQSQLVAPSQKYSGTLFNVLFHLWVFALVAIANV